MDPYKVDQKKLQALWNEAMSDEDLDEVPEPFANCGSSDEYIPSDITEETSDDSSDSNEKTVPKKRAKKNRYQQNKPVKKADLNRNVFVTATGSSSQQAKGDVIKQADKADVAGPSGLQQASMNDLASNTIEAVLSEFTRRDSEMEELADADDSNLVWQDVDGSHLQQFVFNFEGSGIKAELYDLYEKEPYDFFKIFLTDEIITYIVDQTNLYATQKLANKSYSKKSKSKTWIPTSAEELEKFFGVIIWMGFLKAPQLRDYWSENFLFSTNIKKIMTRNLFEQLLSMLHFNDNNTVNEQDQHFDRLNKITPLLKKLIERFQSCLIPQNNVCIDETMVPFRGRLKFKQYIKNKRNKFGIKLYKVCVQAGYTYNLKVYCGKDNEGGGTASFNVVMSLLDGLLDEGRTLYTDNYTSVTLAHELLKRKTYLVGTVRSNRKMNCSEVVKKKLRKHEVFSKESNTGVVMLKWYDKRDVLMLSTKHTSEIKNISKRDNNIPKPLAIIDYNESKSFIDLSDQMKAYHHCLRRGAKWYRKLAMELMFGSALVNAFVLYKEITQKKVSITEFKKQVAIKLLHLGDIENNHTDDIINSNNHCLIEGKKNRCTVCYAKIKQELGRIEAQNKTPRSKYLCSICKTSVCVSCFFEVHSATKNV